MTYVDVTCAACPTMLRLLVATTFTESGAATRDVDRDDLVKQVSLHGWTLLGPLCATCADKMRRTTN